MYSCEGFRLFLIYIYRCNEVHCHFQIVVILFYFYRTELGLGGNMSFSSGAGPTSPTSPTIPESGGAESDSDWKIIQKNVFTRWCNERLKVVKIPVNDLATDLQDGTKFVALVQVLSHKQVGRYNKKPRIYAQKMENVQLALDLLTKVEKIKIVNIGKYHTETCA